MIAVERPYIRQSSMSSVLFEFKAFLSEEEQKLRMRRGTDEHDKAQFYYEKYNGEGESTCTFDGIDLKIAGHIDVEMFNHIIELKFSKSLYFKIYHSYYFQLLFYVISSGKPCAHIITNYEIGDSYVRYFAPDQFQINTLTEALEELSTLYLWKLVEMKKEEGGRYFDSRDKIEQIGKRVIEIMDTVVIPIFNECATFPPQEIKTLWEVYAQQNGWSVYYQ